MELYEQRRKDGLEIIGISLGASPDMVKLFVDRAGINYPVFVAEKDVLEAYSVKGVPLNIFFSRNGKQTKRELGYNEEIKREFTAEVERLLRE